jgi:hypothetical protein
MYAARTKVVQPIASLTTNWVHQTLPQLKFERPELKTPQRQWTDKKLLAYPKVDTIVPPPKFRRTTKQCQRLQLRAGDMICHHQNYSVVTRISNIVGMLHR